MRKKSKYKQRTFNPDVKYKSTTVTRLIKKVMKNGEWYKASKIVYNAADIVERDLSLPFLTVLEGKENKEGVLKNIMPEIELRKQKIGGSSRRLAKKIDKIRSMKIALRWIIESALEKKKNKENKNNKSMSENLAEEIKDAYNKKGGAFKKKINLYKESEQ